MSDVNTFVDNVGQDITAVAVPRIDALAEGISAKVASDYAPRVSAFANDLIKDIIAEQSANVRDFTVALIQELFRRYRPEVLGEVHARVAQGGVALTGHGVKLDLKRQDTGAVVASLDVPISIHIKVADIAVNLRDTTIKFDVL